MTRLVASVLALLLLATFAAADETEDAIARARELRKAGKASEAADVLRKLVEAQPEDVRPMPLLAEILVDDLGETATGTRILSVYVDVSPEDELARWKLRKYARTALLAGEAAATVDAVRTLRARRKQQPDRYLLQLLGLAFYQLGERASARQAWREIIVEWPSDSNAYWQIARTYMDEGKFEDAAQVYEDFIKERSGDVWIRLQLASLELWWLADFPAAEKEYRKALAVARGMDESTPEAAKNKKHSIEQAEKGLEQVAERRRLRESVVARRRHLRILTYVLLGLFAVGASIALHLTRPRP